MKKQIIINSIFASALLFAGASASAQEIDTDLIYGNGSVVPSQGEAFVTGTSVQNELVNDLIYGKQKSVPSRGEAPDLLVDDREISTDLIYGS